MLRVRLQRCPACLIGPDHRDGGFRDRGKVFGLSVAALKYTAGVTETTETQEVRNLTFCRNRFKWLSDHESAAVHALSDRVDFALTLKRQFVN